MDKAYLLTGGNLGNRSENLLAAANYIEQYCGKIVLSSSIYETSAWGIEDQPDFYNQVLLLQTKLSPQALIKQLLKIEEEMGRKRELKMGPRIIDIDILFYDQAIIKEPDLIIPHPRLQERRFVLEPLSQIAADFVHPGLHKKIIQLLEECTDPLNVHKIDSNN